MTPEASGLVGIAALFVLLALRTPVAFAMLVVGFFGYWALEGLRSAGGVLLTESYSTISNYSLIVVPMFILLGNIASAAGFSRGLYNAAFAWIVQLRGGLASASVLGCALFAAVSGSSVATAVTLGKVALPEMRRLGYATSLSTGAIAAGGTLGFLIPPSTGFVLYAILAEQSIGRLFMAGVLPGILMMGLFMAAIWIVAWLKPEAAPMGDPPDWPTRLSALFEALPLVAVILLSIGGIYLGVFTPVEASAVGAALVILLAVARRRLTWCGFRDAIAETLSTSAMLYFIVMGASVLNPFLAVTQIPSALGDGLAAAGLGPYGTLLLIVLGYVVLGMFMDGLSMLVVTVPIVLPTILAQGFDPIWFGVVAVIVIEMGMITPPIGLNVFVVRSVAGPDVPLTAIFRGVMPFLAAMIVTLLLIVAVPGIATWIPNSMFD
ncbi:TRAP transporter large permease [Mesobaculum littorinae]|uniref:TRAP transporter large permease protein n=1 Tax=Mesobaculum littorinae TaxID=2486419 RepID=A0A438AG04_9RHOB|nr:TRAP transporter large permease [Mesobaculum littorinae]RVV97639.1 TRAP transporter large permease [Mesobaculum littorinae]